MSAIPDVLDALVAAWQAADVTLTINGDTQMLQVVDGPVWDAQTDFLAVGWDRSGQPGVVGDGDTEDLAGDREAETFDVSCLLSAWYGGPRDLSAVRRAQFDAFNALRAALAPLTAIGGPADTVTIRNRELTTALVEGGVVSDLRFDVRVTAFG